MSSFLVRGGRPLWGEVTVPPAKNAVLPLLAACLVVPYPVTLLDVPRLSDVEGMKDLLRSLGVSITERGREVTLDASGEINPEVPPTDRMRSSLFALGPLLARCGRATLGRSGGCVIGRRPIDIHLAGLRALGVDVVEEADLVECQVKGEIKGEYRLPYPSVGATVNLVCLATRATRPVTLCGVALEPEVTDLLDFLRQAGVEIERFGRTITVCGRPKRGLRYRPVPDRIWAGTLMGAVAVAGGEVTLQGVDHRLLDEWVRKIDNNCCQIVCGCDTIRVSAWGPHPARHFVTAPYPGFATDLQAMAVVYDATSQGTGLVKETVFEDRFRLLAELGKMGARYQLVGRTAVVKGGRLHGAQVVSCDLRAGAGLVVAGLAASGETVVSDAPYVFVPPEEPNFRLAATNALLFAD
ncbi:MAG: UDP-N-acetylglucosamine 1-carboxyvinyltransferase, partial [Clostridia bacterium]|nr:UDP-N-acetylglucosamine 1-carboxyvinyltransferase [Clostridia bacterium]